VLDGDHNLAFLYSVEFLKEDEVPHLPVLVFSLKLYVSLLQDAVRVEFVR